jgi:hypothetical protein
VSANLHFSPSRVEVFERALRQIAAEQTSAGA